MKKALVLAVFCLVGGLAGVARADDADDTRAKQQYKEGVALYEKGDYRAAIDKYRAADDVLHLPALPFNIAQAYRKLGDCKLALAFYRAYLELDPESKQRDAILRRVQELEDELAGRTEVEPPVG